MNEAEPVASEPLTAGEILRAAREHQGVHLAVLAASLKVAPRKLELLESNRHDELPDATFARALALSMCRALKIDPEPVLAKLPQPHSQRLDVMGGGLNQPFRDREVAYEAGEWRRFLTLPILGAAALVIAALAIWLVPARKPSPEQVALPAASAPATAAADAAPGGPVPGTTPAQAPTDATAQATAGTASAPGATSPAASAVVDTVFLAPPDAAASAIDGGVLTVRVDAASWIEVRDRSGQVLLSRTLAAGETTGLDGEAPLRVVVGNAAATHLVFRGQPVAISDATRENIARLELK